MRPRTPSPRRLTIPCSGAAFPCSGKTNSLFGSPGNSPQRTGIVKELAPGTVKMAPNPQNSLIFSLLAGNWRIARPRLSPLRLPRRLGDLELDGERLAAAAVVGTAHRSGAEVVEPDGDADVLVGDAEAAGGIEADPAEIGDMGFRPGVAGVVRDAVVA